MLNKFYMRRAIFSFIVICISFALTAGDFPREDYDAKKKIILLANPTSGNIKTIKYLTDNKLLKINIKKTQFVGVYHKDQSYDFNRSRRFIEEQNLKNFYLHEITCTVYSSGLFNENACSSELKSLFENSAGIFFFGGPDIPPAVYEESNSRSIVTDPVRHYFEVTFLFHLLGGFSNESFKPLLDENPDYFITGFCLGLQTFNVATGGTLIQDIPAEIYNADDAEEIVKIEKSSLHCNYWQTIFKDSLLMGINIHPITFTDNPFFGKRVKVNGSITPDIYSSHHQAIEKPGKGFEITALSVDEKIIEGIAHNKYPQVFAVQFHPEVPALYEDMTKLKFHPGDEPETYHKLIGKTGLSFHKRYWKFVSKALKKSLRKSQSSK